MEASLWARGSSRYLSDGIILPEPRLLLCKFGIIWRNTNIIYYFIYLELCTMWTKSIMKVWKTWKRHIKAARINCCQCCLVCMQVHNMLLTYLSRPQLSCFCLPSLRLQYYVLGVAGSWSQLGKMVLKHTVYYLLRTKWQRYTEGFGYLVFIPPGSHL